MPTFSVESHANRGPTVKTTGINTSNVTGYSALQRVMFISKADSTACGVPSGWYEHVREESNGDWIYAPANRHL